MGIISAVVGNAANVSPKHSLISDMTMALMLNTDQYAGAYLHLRCFIYCDGDCRCSVPFRAVWSKEQLRATNAVGRPKSAMYIYISVRTGMR